MEYVILIIVIAVLALGTGGWLLFVRPGRSRGRTLEAPRPAGQIAELGGLGPAEPAVQGPARRRYLGRDRRGADHGRRGRGARPADGRRAQDQGQGARHAEP